MRDDRRLRIEYRRPDRSPSTSDIDPLGLVHKTGTWYLVAARGATRRVFRVDRVITATTLDAPAQRPAGFELTRFWQDWKQSYVRTLPTFEAHARLGPTAMRFRDRIGPLAPREVTDERLDDDDWTDQRLTFDDTHVATAALLALSPEVEVLGPPRLRTFIATADHESLPQTRGERQAPAGTTRQTPREAPREGR